jgi:hypothetical protein
VNIIGEFNDLGLNVTLMKKLKSGDFIFMLDLETDQAYQFRYLIDQERWINDSDSGAYLPSSFSGIDNSVIAL